MMIIKPQQNIHSNKHDDNQTTTKHSFKHKHDDNQTTTKHSLKHKHDDNQTTTKHSLKTNMMIIKPRQNIH